jgi:predicted N-acetyltransferase YhbS
MNSSDFVFRPAAPEDASAIMELINQAFAIERKFFSADRIDLPGVADHLQKGAFLLAESDGALAGCVYTELRRERGYFGLLAVAPGQQGRGLGTLLVTEAEDLCREAGCSVMELRILHLRTELPPYYEKLGYTVARTEETEPDPSALQPYHFIVMEKTIGE